MLLNNEQVLASRADYGIDLVLAGAGTGKTKTLVEKIKNCIEILHLSPDQLLVLTFSRRAAGEIKERVMSSPGLSAGSLVTGTFHSICYRLLREYSESFFQHTSYKKFPVVIDADRKDEIIETLINANIDAFQGIPSDVIFDFIKNSGGIHIKTRKKLETFHIMPEINMIHEKYNQYKKEQGLIDYNDMLSICIDMIQKDPLLRAKLHTRFRYVMVDEFQDTSSENFELLRLLLPEKGANLFAVGDSDQLIYSFNGSDIRYVLRFKKYFPEAKVITLKINYRSRNEIIKVSNRFIRKNRKRVRKKLVSNKGRGGSVVYHAVEDHTEEIDCIKKIVPSLKEEVKNVAILYRNNWQGEIIKKKLGPVFKGKGNRNVQLMTIHASKGLEFDSVIVAGISDSIIPDRENDIEEERRLLYVAMTRAREDLHVICHRSNRGDISLFGTELGMK